jgi:hypothetical protein
LCFLCSISAQLQSPFQVEKHHDSRIAVQSI